MGCGKRREDNGAGKRSGRKRGKKEGLGENGWRRQE